MIYIVLFTFIFKLNPFKKDLPGKTILNGYMSDSGMFGIFKARKEDL